MHNTESYYYKENAVLKRNKQTTQFWCHQNAAVVASFQCVAIFCCCHQAHLAAHHFYSFDANFPFCCRLYCFEFCTLIPDFIRSCASAGVGVLCASLFRNSADPLCRMQFFFWWQKKNGQPNYMHENQKYQHYSAACRVIFITFMATFFSFEVLWNMQERPEYVICRYTYIQSIYSDFLATELKNLVKSKNAMDKKSQSTIILSLTSIERGEGYWLFCQAAYSLCYIIISHFLASDNFHFKLWNIIRS